MRLRRKILGTTACLVLMVMGTWADDTSTPLLHPDRLKALTELKGSIRAMDVPAHRITLEDSSHQQVIVTVSSDTAVTDAGNHNFSWTSLRVGDPVNAYYAPKSHIVLQIDRQPTTAEKLLNIDHPHQ